MIGLLVVAALAAPQDAGPAARIAAAIASGDAEAIDAVVDSKHVWEALTADLGLSRMALARYRAESFPDFSFGMELRRLVPAGARVDVLPASARDAGKTARVVLRCARERELEYVTLELDGERLVDATVARAGESVLTSARRAMVVAITRDKAGLLKKLSEPEKSYVRAVPTLELIDNKCALGEGEAALAAFGRLPPLLTAERAFLFLRLAIARETGEGERDAALAACLAAYPDDLGTNLHALDLALAAGEAKAVLTAVARLEKLVRGDAMLKCLRGRSHLERGDTRGAKIAFGQAVAAQPDLPAGHWGLIDVAVSRKDYRALPKLLTALEEKCSVDLGDLSARPEFEGFVKSRYYATWKTRRGG